MFGLLLLCFLPILGAVFTLYFKVNFLTSIIFFFIIPSLWLTIRIGKKSIRALSFSIICGFFATLIIDPIASYSHVWNVKSIFSFKILEVSPEQFIWGVFFIYLIVSFYEFFFPKKSRHFLDNKMIFLGLIFLIAFVLTRFIKFSFPSSLDNYYLYMSTGIIIFILPILIMLIKFPKMKNSLLKTAVYFLFLSSLYEFVALKLGLWSFPGTSSVYINGFYIAEKFLPIEEILYFTILGSSAVLSYYLLFNMETDLLV